MNGIRAATAAGMPTVAVPCRVTEDCDFSQADLVLHSLIELPALFAGTR